MNQKRINTRLNEEPQKSLAFMQSPNDWPRWPALPIKRYDKAKPGSMPECAVLCADGTPTVYMANMLELGGKKFTDFPSKRYGSFNDLVADGWIVD